MISHTKITLATRIIKKMEGLAKFESEVWCIDLGYLDKIVKNKICVKFLSVHQDLFNRTVDAKGNEKKTSDEIFPAFSTMA